MNERRQPRPEYLAALLTTILWGATAFATAGALALALDRDPITASVDRLYGFLALGLVGVLVWLVCAVTARSPAAWPGMLAAGAGAYLIAVGTGMVVDFALAAEQALSPFVIAASLLAGLAPLFCRVLVGSGAPRSRD